MYIFILFLIILGMSEKVWLTYVWGFVWGFCYVGLYVFCRYGQQISPSIQN